jgi:hypothetical protein
LPQCIAIESEAREVLFEQPRPELEIGTSLEEESCVVSIQPLAKREGFIGLARLAAGEHIIACRAEHGHLDAVLAEDRLERLHGSLDDKEEQDVSQRAPQLIKLISASTLPTVNRTVTSVCSIWMRSTRCSGTP